MGDMKGKMITRDEYGIICQYQLDSDNTSRLDGGDSLSRTAIMALCGNEKDINLLHLFVSGAQLVRHPFQDKWNDPENTSRDQAVPALMTGHLSWTLVCHYYVFYKKVNKDFLDFGVIYAACKVNEMNVGIFLRILGPTNLFIDLLWNCFIKPNDEMNQFTCICISMGKWWSQKLIKWHPDIEKNIRSYWGGWRNQIEIGEALISKLKSVAEIK